MEKQISFSKMLVGSYMISVDGEHIGDVHKSNKSDEWHAFSSPMHVGVDVHVVAKTRKEAVRQLLAAIEDMKIIKEAEKQSKQETIQTWKEAHLKSVKMDDEIVKADQARMMAAEIADDKKEADKEFLLHLDLQHFSSSNWKDLVRVAVGSGISPGDIIKTAERGRRMRDKIASNVQRALYDMRDSGECYIKEPDVKDLLIKELNEMGIVHTVYNMNYVDDGLVYYVVQGEF